MEYKKKGVVIPLRSNGTRENQEEEEEEREDEDCGSKEIQVKGERRGPHELVRKGHLEKLRGGDMRTVPSVSTVNHTLTSSCRHTHYLPLYSTPGVAGSRSYPP